MMQRYRLSRPLAVVVALGLGIGVLAQEEPAARPSYARMLNIDALLDNHARFLSRRYNLSAEQDEFTKAYLKAKADEFLARHREDLFDLVDALMALRSGAAMSQEELLNWGHRALPIFEEAKGFIIEGNETWRGILTEEQKVRHDEDLRDMYENFATTEVALQRIVTEQMTVDEFRSGPRPQPRPQGDSPAPNQPPLTAGTPTAPTPRPPPPNTLRPGGTGETRPVQPGPPRGGNTGPPRGGNVGPPRGPGPQARPGTTNLDTFESQWDAYVRDFVARFQLDEAQIQRAQAILDDCKTQAAQYTSRREAEIRRLDDRLVALNQSTDANRGREIARVNEQKTRLLKPIDDIFERSLKPRLERLPTRQQREAAEKSAQRPPTPVQRPGAGARPAPVRPAPPPPPQEDPAHEESGGEE